MDQFTETSKPISNKITQKRKDQTFPPKNMTEVRKFFNFLIGFPGKREKLNDNSISASKICWGWITLITSKSFTRNKSLQRFST